MLWLGGFEVCVVNAWMMYQQYHEDGNLEMVYNHYNFVKAASKVYINPINFWPTQHCLHLKYIECNKPKPLWQLKDTKQCVPITDKSLFLETGSLRCHHDLKAVHFPNPVKRKKNPTSCQLHMWAFKKCMARGSATNNKLKGACSWVSRCSICHVHLCMDCFEIFHKVVHLANVVDEILKY